MYKSCVYALTFCMFTIDYGLGSWVVCIYMYVCMYVYNYVLYIRTSVRLLSLYIEVKIPSARNTGWNLNLKLV